MKATIIAACLLLASCGQGETATHTWCADGVPANFQPQILTGADGRQYFVAFHTGCVFTVRELPRAGKRSQGTEP